MLVHHRDQELFKLALALWSDDAAFHQDRTQLIDQCRPFTNQPVPRPVERLHIELRFCLHLDKTHRRTSCRFGDPFCVTVVIFLRFDVRPDVFGGHQSDVVSQSCEQSSKVMGAATSLHADDANRQFGDQIDERISPNPTTQDHSAGRVQTDHTAHVLSKIDAKDCNLHIRSSVRISDETTSPGGRGGPFHKLRYTRAEIRAT